MIYIGTLGRMIGIKCPATQRVQSAERYGFATTLEGRVKAQARPLGRRVWDLQTSDATTPAEHSLLSQFANGAWGPGPFVFVSADAPHSNMLTPGFANCTDSPVILASIISKSGPVQLADGMWAASSYVSSDPAQTMWFGARDTPVIPGQKVTASAYVQGPGSRVYVGFWDASDNFISSVGSQTSGTDSIPSRHSATAVVPSNAVRAGVGGTSTIRGALPAITWTDSVLPWSDGQGCLKSVVHAFARDQVLAVQGHTYSDVSFTVTEVG